MYDCFFIYSGIYTLLSENWNTFHLSIFLHPSKPIPFNMSVAVAVAALTVHAPVFIPLHLERTSLSSWFQDISSPFRMTLEQWTSSHPGQSLPFFHDYDFLSWVRDLEFPREPYIHEFTSLFELYHDINDAISLPKTHFEYSSLRHDFILGTAPSYLYALYSTVQDFDEAHSTLYLQENYRKLHLLANSLQLLVYNITNSESTYSHSLFTLDDSTTYPTTTTSHKRKRCRSKRPHYRNHNKTSY